jgi:Na+/H+ antiporter NhaD/arsenite permease-like protein
MTHTEKSSILKDKILYRIGLEFGIAILVLILSFPAPHIALAHESDLISISGTVSDQQDQPVSRAHVKVFANNEPEPIHETETNEQGIFLADLPVDEIDSLAVEISHPQFKTAMWSADGDDVAWINTGKALRIPDFTIERQITVGFWIAAVVFILVLTLIITEKMHNTLAALLGAGILLVISLIGDKMEGGFYIFDFEVAIEYVDFNVIFLVLGMMIIVGIIERTGIFQWVAYHAYRISRGKLWLLAIILMLFTSVASALLDNVTTMLLVTPITIQISLTLGLNPLSLLIPEMLASNIGGIATLIGTPNNILIGSYADLGFNDFLRDLTPGVLLVQVVITLYVIYIFRAEYKTSSETDSESLLNLLRENAQITEPETLKRAGIVFIFTLILFAVGENFHLVPAVTAMIGAAVTLAVVNLDVDEILHIVDWSILLFFIALFMIVGAIQEVGLISLIADVILDLVGGNLTAAAIVVIWGTGMMCLLVPTIPLTAALLPVVGFLSQFIPGAGSNILYYALSMGSALGANNSLIGATNNMVTAGIAKRAGFPISYRNFIKIGFPAALISLLVGSVYILLRF